MRQITDHKVNPEHDLINISVTDDPGAGGANQRYELTGFDVTSNPSAVDAAGNRLHFSKMVVLFQNGPIKENGVNGLTIESLIAICIDRLHGFQSGPYACEENDRSLRHLQMTLEILLSRTRERIARGVEGTNQL